MGVKPTVNEIDSEGFVGNIRQIESPNKDARPKDVDIDLLIIHSISLPPGDYAGGDIEAFFCNKLDVKKDPFYESIKDLRVSAHFLIRRDGEVIQFVSTELRAWHAGKSEFFGKNRCNDFSIGIEVEGCDEDSFANLQYASLSSLVKTLQGRYPGITSERVVGHSDVSPGRKTDPGPRFDWSSLKNQLKK